MVQKLVNFIKYHNAFTIVFVILFLGFGVASAVSPEVRDSVYSSKETVVSIDNGLIVSADLDNFDFNLRISSVTEDETNYYAAYSYRTLVVEDSVWKNKEIEKTLTVSKEALGGKDLGLYVTEELGENINYELSYLKRVQSLERGNGKSLKVVTVAYAGLIGKLLNPKEKVIEGYNPVIPEPEPEVAPAAAIASIPDSKPQEIPTETTIPKPSTLSDTPVGAGEVVPKIIPEATSTPVSAPVIGEATSTPVQATSTSILISTSTPAHTEPAPEPAPSLLNEASSTPASEPPATSTQEIVSEPTP